MARCQMFIFSQLGSESTAGLLRQELPRVTGVSLVPSVNYIFRDKVDYVPYTLRVTNSNFDQFLPFPQAARRLVLNLHLLEVLVLAIPFFQPPPPPTLRAEISQGCHRPPHHLCDRRPTGETPLGQRHLLSFFDHFNSAFNC
jgi:hypothetical protein